MFINDRLRDEHAKNFGKAIQKREDSIKEDGVIMPVICCCCSYIKSGDGNGICDNKHSLYYKKPIPLDKGCTSFQEITG